MIYLPAESASPLQQGDILHPVPIPDFDPLISPVLKPDGGLLDTWINLKPREAVINARVRNGWGIVVSQDCDASHSSGITLMEIGDLAEVSGESLPADTNLEKWVRFITKHPKINPTWFYLPRDGGAVGFPSRMAVDFETVFQLPLDSLTSHLPEIRRGRLHPVALDHLRHALSFFFTRFAFDDWYAMTKDEFHYYSRGRTDMVPFDWQR